MTGQYQPQHGWAPASGIPPVVDAPGVAVAAASLGFIQAVIVLVIGVLSFVFAAAAGDDGESALLFALAAIMLGVVLIVAALRIFKRRSPPLLVASFGSLALAAVSIGLSITDPGWIGLALAFAVLPAVTIGLLSTAQCRAWTGTPAR